MAALKQYRVWLLPSIPATNVQPFNLHYMIVDGNLLYDIQRLKYGLPASKLSSGVTKCSRFSPLVINQGQLHYCDVSSGELRPLPHAYDGTIWFWEHHLVTFQDQDYIVLTQFDPVNLTLTEIHRSQLLSQYKTKYDYESLTVTVIAVSHKVLFYQIRNKGTFLENINTKEVAKIQLPSHFTSIEMSPNGEFIVFDFVRGSDVYQTWPFTQVNTRSLYDKVTGFLYNSDVTSLGVDEYQINRDKYPLPQRVNYFTEVVRVLLYSGLSLVSNIENKRDITIIDYLNRRHYVLRDFLSLIEGRQVFAPIVQSGEDRYFLVVDGRNLRVYYLAPFEWPLAGVYQDAVGTQIGDTLMAMQRQNLWLPQEIVESVVNNILANDA